MTSILALLLLIALVNALPFLAHMTLHERFAWPVDGGRSWADGRRLLGHHKTVRGLLSAIVGGGLAAPLLGFSWWLGLLVGFLAMLGDLLSSFIKRRWGDPSGKPRFAADQLLESLLPAIALCWLTAMVCWQVLAAVALFIPLAHVGSRFIHFLLYRPSPDNYPRYIRSTTRFREWRACHQPMSNWERLLNFENYVFYRVIIAWTFRTLGLYKRGVANTLAVRLTPHTLYLRNLPKAFDGWRILLLTDLHIDGVEGLTEVLIDQVAHKEVDLCLLGGDMRMELYGPMAPALRRLKRLVTAVDSRHGVYGVLGNHDCIEMLPDLEHVGISMLVNDSCSFELDGQQLWLVGIDDPHYYRCHDLDRAYLGVPENAFVLFLAHTPEVYKEAAAKGADLYLCGHTHGGQICLPRLGPIFTHCKAPRRLAAGPWEHQGMPGYTSRGAGASGVPVRYNCPGEISLLTLRRGTRTG